MQLRRDYDHLYFGARGRWLYLVAESGALRVLDLARPTAPEDNYHGRLTPEGIAVRDVAPLLGRHSLLVADAAGGIAQWFMVRSAFGERLRFPADFVGRGDMSRGGLLLRAVRAGVELEYTPVATAVVRGRRPPRLEPIAVG